jgi:hypothetical protein
MWLARGDFLVALRRDAGVMFGETSSSDSSRPVFVSRIGVLGR